MSATIPTRDELATLYLDQLPYEPYPVQEEALLSWFTSEQGVLVCAPTGTGKTLIAEAALFEALHTGKIAYYTTPLIALTEQKYQEMREAAVRWGFDEDSVGLVTGNRRVNPNARILVVVAEILLNRLLHTAAFDFTEVSAVVMDEFHSFADPSRGIVWELSLGLLPAHVRLLLLSATVGNASEFRGWLRQFHDRKIDLVQGTERKVPLRYNWIPDQLLNEQLEMMAAGDEDSRKTPALVFCFNREECWSVAEQLKGKKVLAEGQRKKLIAEIDQYDWSQGVGPKLKPILLRGIGVHHAGLLPRYKRIVEHLFQRKLLSVAVCTETLSAGMNLPARSVVMTSLLKGPPGKKKLVDASTAHQIFGRAGRPQFDTEGYVYALAHEDDVKILRWKEKYDTIPEDTKDPMLIRAKKAMKKKMPTRRKTEQYWEETHFEKLKAAPPGKLYSKGPFTWRLLAYLLSISPDVDIVRKAVSKRLMEPKQLQAAQKNLHRMLRTLHAGGYVTLDPPPPAPPVVKADGSGDGEADAASPEPPVTGTMAALLEQAQQTLRRELKTEAKRQGVTPPPAADDKDDSAPDEYRPNLATPTPRLAELLAFRSVNPIYGAFLVEHLGKADRDERIQALESVLDIPRSVLKPLQVPSRDLLPPGPLALGFLDSELLQRGLATAEELNAKSDEDDDNKAYDRWTPRLLTLGDKLRRLFDAEYPDVHDLRTQPVWAVGELLRFNGDFNKLVTSRGFAKQEGILFRHVLRFILLLDEFEQLTPPGLEPEEWQAELKEIGDLLTESCRKIDPESTDKLIESAHAADIVEGETVDPTPPPAPARDADTEDSAVDSEAGAVGSEEGGEDVADDATSDSDDIVW